jgi:hypothetical protein
MFERGKTGMISPKFDFDEFVRVVRDRDYREILGVTQEENRETARRIAGGVRGAPAARKAGAGEYKNLLGGLIFLLVENRKPSSVYDWDLQRMRPILENLVRKGELGPEVLRVFG